MYDAITLKVSSPAFAKPHWTCAFLGFVFFSLTSTSAVAQVADDNVARQIQALINEKESRTPAQQKISSQLLYATKMRRGESIAREVPVLEVDVAVDSQGKVVVDLSADVDEDLLADLERSGVEVLSVNPRYHHLRVKVALSQLETIAGYPQVRFIRPKRTASTHQIMASDNAVLFSWDDFYLPFLNQRAQSTRLGFMQSTMGHPHPNIVPAGYPGIGAANAEGVTTHGIYSARGTFNVDGSGIRIGVLSDAVDNLALSQASGDLPATCSTPTPLASERCVQVVPGQAGSGGDEGTAMMEVIHDMVPGAQLYFATAFTDIESFADNIRTLRTIYHCDVIVDDVSYYVESPFQDGQGPLVVSPNDAGIVTQAVNDVVSDGALYFSSAANSGNKNDATSSTWEGDFANGGTLGLVAGGNVHDFDSTAAVAQYDAITVANSGSPINLHWSDPLGGSNNDYDLFVLNTTGTAVAASSTDIQNGTQDPYEEVGTNNLANRRIVILQKTGAANRFLHLSTNGGGLTFSTNGETHGHSAASGGYGVAAVPAYSPFDFPPPPPQYGPYPSLFNTTSTVETFSSDGPRRIFFNADGTAITPGNFSSTGGTLLQQPVISAADGQEVTGVGGFGSPFFGTSCAAPSAASIAALLKSANPAITAGQMRTALTTTAVDIEAAGVDQDSGYGIAMAYPALQSIAATGRAFVEFNGATATETCCNSNGVIDPGENATLSVNLKNTGVSDATGITTTLSTSTPGVTILHSTSAYANLSAAGGTGSNSVLFTFQLANSAAEIDTNITFILTVNYTGGWSSSQTINFPIQTGRRAITTTLDTTAPTTSVSFPTTATNTQTARLTRTDPPSSCGVAKAFPGTTGSGSRRFDSYTLTNFNSEAACATVTLTIDKTGTDYLQAVAYLGSFNPASLNTNYLGDIGASPTLGYSKSMSFLVPANNTVVIVVNETSASGSGTGTPYTLQVSSLGRPDLLFRDGYE